MFRKRYFRLVQLSIIIMIFAAIFSMFYAIRFFGNIVSTTVTDYKDAFAFVSNITLALAIIFSIYFGKKYLYNFNFFVLSININEDENLIPTNEFSFLPEDYEDIPEPYKIQIPIYYLIGFSAISILTYLIYYIVVLLTIFPESTIYKLLNNFYLYLQSNPFFHSSLFTVIATIFYSSTMYYQIEIYKKYYTILLKETNEDLDLTEELQEK